MISNIYIKVVIAPLLLLLVGSSLSNVHPLKMTFSKMSMSQSGEISITTKYFLDDLTQQMQQKYRLQKADFSSSKSNGTLALQNYMDSHLLISQDGTDTSLIIQSVSIDEDNLVLMVTASTMKHLEVNAAFTLTNSLFFDVFPNQINSVRYKKEDITFRLREATHRYE